VECYCEHGNEPSGSTKFGGILKQLGNLQLLNKGSILCSFIYTVYIYCHVLGMLRDKQLQAVLNLANLFHSIIQLHNSQFHIYCHLQYHKYFSCWSHCHALDTTQLVVAGLRLIQVIGNWLNTHCSLNSVRCSLFRLGTTDTRYCCQVFLPSHCLAIGVARTPLLCDAVFTDCLATVVARSRLLRDVTASRRRVFTERCAMIGVGVDDVTRGNAEFT
jgi:hypothetical protein